MIIFIISISWCKDIYIYTHTETHKEFNNKQILSKTQKINETYRGRTLPCCLFTQDDTL